jgi:hypothetical protein
MKELTAKVFATAGNALAGWEVFLRVIRYEKIAWISLTN